MSLSLKAQNSVGLYGLMAANLGLFYVTAQHDSILGGDWRSAVTKLGEAIPVAIGLVLTGVVSAQFSPNAKARIVFWRWRHPLPGSEAFTRHAKTDPRVDLKTLKSAFGPLPTSARDQNALWYRMYKSVESDPAVNQAHRAYLFARDYACLSLLAFALLGIAGFIQIPSAKTAGIYAGVLALQFLLARRAASTHGRRLVTSVLARKSAGR